jgi:hypothetical protein
VFWLSVYDGASPGRNFKIAKYVRPPGAKARRLGERFVPASEGAGAGEPEYLHLQALSDDNKRTWLLALRSGVAEVGDGTRMAGRVSFLGTESDDELQSAQR